MDWFFVSFFLYCNVYMSTVIIKKLPLLVYDYNKT